VLHPRPLHPTDLRIGRFVLRASLDELELDGQRTKLEPRLTQVLLSLAAHPGQVVSAQDLHQAVWGRVRVTTGSIYEAIARLRQVLAADGEVPAYIATVPRRGYRLVAPVARPVQDKAAGPRLVVLPFRAAGLEARLAPLRERLLEGLIVALSRQTPCTVMARGSVLALAAAPGTGDGAALGRAARLFDARFVVDGTLTSRGSGVVVRAELIDAERRELLWAEAVESPPQDGPELAGPTIERLARALNLHLMAALAREGPGTFAEPRRLAMGSWVELFCRPQNEATNERAWALSQQALGQDGDEVLGKVTRAYAGWRAASYGWQGLPSEATFAAALADAEAAVALAPQLHDAHFVLSLLAGAHGESARAEEATRHCLRLVPDLAPAWGMLGAWRFVRGHPEETAALCERALALSPCEPLRATWHWHVSRAALALGEPQQALDAAERALAANPDLPGGYLCGVMAAQQLGRTDLVERWLGWVMARPRYATIARLRASHRPKAPAMRRQAEQMIELFRAAGLPES